MKRAFFIIFVVLTGVASQASGTASAADAKRGKSLYELRCAVCHGTTGRGDGVAGKAMSPQPTNLTDPTIFERLTEPYFYAVIRVGKLEAMNQGEKLGFVPLWMPEHPDLTRDQISGLVALVREIQKVKPAQSKLSEVTARHPSAYDLYKKHCMQCHGENFDGKGPDTGPKNQNGKTISQVPRPPDFRNDLFMNRFSDQALGKIIEYGTKKAMEKGKVTVMIGLGSKNWPDESVANLLAYLKTLGAPTAVVHPKSGK